MPTEVVTIIRWIHVMSATAWFGEVLVLNVILIPAMSQMAGTARREYMNAVFTRVFRLASILSGTAVIAGLSLLLIMTEGDLTILPESRWGIFIMTGGGLALLIASFHFFMEQKLAAKIGVGDCEVSPDDEEDDPHGKLNIVPRVALLILTGIFLSMMYAVRGL